MKANSYVIKKLPAEEIINKYKNGTSIISLSKQYNCGQGTITRFLKEHNVTLRTIQESVGGVHIPNSAIPKIRSLYLSGKTKGHICQLYKCSINTLKAFLKKNKIKKRNPQSRLPLFMRLKKDKKIISKLYKETQSLTPLLKKYNCDFSSMSTFMDGAGIKRKNNIFNPILIKDKQRVYDLHHNEMYTMDQIAKLYNCTAPTVADFFDKNNIPRRSQAETSRLTAQNPETIKKQRRSMATHKEYKLPSGKIIKIQGYEPQFLDYCFSNNIFKENDFDFETIMKFQYTTSDGKLHYYYPDFYIPKQNIIVEVKSWYILEKNPPEIQKLKARAVKRAGYRYIFILDNNFKPIDSFRP